MLNNEQNDEECPSLPQDKLATDDDTCPELIPGVALQLANKSFKTK